LNHSKRTKQVGSAQVKRLLPEAYQLHYRLGLEVRPWGMRYFKLRLEAGKAFELTQIVTSYSAGEKSRAALAYLAKPGILAKEWRWAIG